MKKILVTGAKGQLGSELQSLCLNIPSAVWVFTDVEDIDLTNQRGTIDKVMDIHPKLIINCAAYTAVDKAETDQQRAYAINDTGTANLVLAAQKCKAQLVHISTDYVFDGTANVPYNELDTPNPASVYGKSKYAGELHVVNYPEGYIFRTSWLYSSFGNNFVKTILRLAKERPELTIVADQFGAPTYAHDLATALMDIFVRREVAGAGGIFHFANRGDTSWYGFASEIVRLAALPCKVSPITTAKYPLPAPRPAYSIMDTTTVCNTFCIEIPHWKDSLREAMQLINK